MGATVVMLKEKVNNNAQKKEGLDKESNEGSKNGRKESERRESKNGIKPKINK